MADRRKILYLSGPMAGSPDKGRGLFNSTEAFLIEKGYLVLNPAWLPLGMPSEYYIPICLAMLEKSDAIYMIGDFVGSQGCELELAYAKYLGKDVLIDGVKEEE